MNKKVPIGFKSHFRVGWAVFIIVTALFAALVTAFRLTYGTNVPDLLYGFIIAVYVTDIIVSFNTAVKERFDIVEDRRRIAAHYIKSWFFIDLIAALPLAGLIQLFIPHPAGSLLSLCVVIGFLPFVKLLKVNAIFTDLQYILGLNPSMMRLLVFGFWFVIAVHGISLGWIIIGAAERGLSPVDQYVRSLYWCTTTIATIGYGDYVPDHAKRNQIIYTICVEIIGVGMYGYIIGNVAMIITNIDVAKTRFLEKMEEINRYMTAKRIPADLQRRVRDYYYYMWETRKSSSAEVFTSDLPHTISLDISLFLNRAIIEKVALFRNIGDIFIREIVRLLRPVVFLPGDFIIRQGEYGDCMYFIDSGDVEVLVGEKRVAVLGSGSPFGETALIQNEKRMASVRALTYCDGYRLSRDDFDTVRRKYPEFDEQIRRVVAERLKDTREKMGEGKV